MASDDAALTDEATSHWHALVHDGVLTEDDPGLQRLRSLTVYGSQRICTVVRPNLVTRPRYEAEKLAVSLVASALAKACAYVSTRPELLVELGVSPEEKELLLIDPGFENYDVTDRFDAFVSKRLGFVEAQGGAPGGIGYHDAVIAAFAETDLLDRFRESYRLEPLAVVGTLREALLSAWSDFGGDGDPAVAIVDWEDAPLMPEFELIRDDFVAAGLETTICDPRQLGFEGGELRLDGERVDVVYRRLTLMDILDRPDDAAALVEASRAGAACLINPFASDLMGHKSLFEIVGNPELDLGLSPAERNAVHTHVPFSRELVSAPRPHSAEVGPDYAIEHRGELVLKPTHELGGHGVSLGWETEPEEWERLVGASCDSNFIVQHRIREHHEPFAVDEPGFPVRHFYIDNDPYIFRGKGGGILARLSAEGGITNVTQGGSMVPTFVVEPL